MAALDTPIIDESDTILEINSTTKKARTGTIKVNSHSCVTNKESPKK